MRLLKYCLYRRDACFENALDSDSNPRTGIRVQNVWVYTKCVIQFLHFNRKISYSNIVLHKKIILQFLFEQVFNNHGQYVIMRNIY